MRAIVCIFLYSFISLVNEVFTFGVLAQFAASVLVICLTAFEFTVVSTNKLYFR